MLKRTHPLRRSRRLRRAGKKTTRWAGVRRQLKVEFEAAGRVVCEIGLKGCRRDDQLSFMHRYKRRFITTDEEMRTVCLACVPCHQFYELGPHAEMKKAVDAAIARRKA